MCGCLSSGTWPTTQESNRRPFGSQASTLALNPLSHASQGMLLDFSCQTCLQSSPGMVTCEPVPILAT